MEKSARQKPITDPSGGQSLLHVVADPPYTFQDHNGKRDRLTNVAILDHCYDGIYELDNPMPSWMWAMFAASIVFAIGYTGYYWIGSGTTEQQQYASAYTSYEQNRITREKSEASSVTEEVMATAMANPTMIDQGAAIFKTKCVACHNANGEGLVGPNLTDDFQIHGNSRRDIFMTIRAGVGGTAMIAWSDQLQPNELIAAAAYTASLRGKRVAGKSAEGEKAAPFPAVE